MRHPRLVLAALPVLAALATSVAACSNKYEIEYVTADGGSGGGAGATDSGTAGATDGGAATGDHAVSDAGPTGVPCTQPRCTIATGQGKPVGIAVDARYVYWANAGDNRIMRAPVDGGEATTIAVDQGGPWFVALTSTDVYWNSRGANTVSRAPTIGGATTVMVSTGQPTNIAVANGALYWLDFQTGAIDSMPASGGPTTGVLGPTAQSFAFAVDANAAYSAAAANIALVYRAPLGAPTAWGTSPGTPTMPMAMVSDGTDLYWTASGTGGGSIPFDDGVTANSRDGAIATVPVGGGTWRAIQANVASPNGIAVDGPNVYWTYGFAGGGGVMKMAKTGGLLTPIALDQGVPAYVAVDGTYAYWTNYGTGTIERAPK